MISPEREWQEFVREHGFRANAHDLACVLKVDHEEVIAVRTRVQCTPLSTSKSFEELYALHHGREPSEADWPAPRKEGAGHYGWQSREIALLATLVGTIPPETIAQVLTERLRKLTGDPQAERTRASVLVRMHVIGLQTSDLVGGLTVKEAGEEIGSLAVVTNMTQAGEIKTTRVGRRLVIPYAEWERWKSTRVFPPEDFVQLSTLREPLGIKSDGKLSEFARMGHIPTAVRCNPYGSKGRSTRWGSWYICPLVARQLLEDRRAGRPMPWHGKPIPDNLQATFKLWSERRHPESCKTCAEIWGPEGAPTSKEDYFLRYPPLAHGQKRHLSMKWHPGLTVKEIAAKVGRPESHVRAAIDNGTLVPHKEGRTQFVSRSDATRWESRGCPTGTSVKSWASLELAARLYLFTLPELNAMIKSGELTSKIGEHGAMMGVVYVSKAHCAALREKLGFSEVEAARRAGVTVERFRRLLEGVNWRGTDGIPLSTVQAVIKRLQSRQGFTLDEAAADMDAPLQWVKDRVDDGTVRVRQAPWDRRRVYLTDPMMDRLRTAWTNRMAGHSDLVRLGQEWLLLNEASLEAGVAAATLMRWADPDDVICERVGTVTRRMTTTGWRYHQESVRACARRYWPTQRFHRAKPPAWLTAEIAAASGASALATR